MLTHCFSPFSPSAFHMSPIHQSLFGDLLDGKSMALYVRNATGIIAEIKPRYNGGASVDCQYGA
jgi:hypothetical protein